MFRKILKFSFKLFLTLAVLGLVYGGYIYYNLCYGEYEYEVEKPVYKPGVRWDYIASFYDSKGSIYKTDSISMKVYDKGRFFGSNGMAWGYTNDIASDAVNPLGFVNGLTGIVENKKKIWLHPCRVTKDYWSFTEFAGFPSINKPFELGSTYEDVLILGNDFVKEVGDRKINVVRELVGMDTVGGIEQYIISGKCKTSVGSYTSLMRFEWDRGFSMLSYEKPSGEKLVFRLIGCF